MNTPKTVDEYLAGLPDLERATLERLRATIRAAAPEATETISYGIPTFRYDGALVGYAAFKRHCSLFPMSTAVMDAHREELHAHPTSKGTIRFTCDEPLPGTLVEQIVKERIAENAARNGGH